ncbi:MAG: hypothetical protein LBI85_01180 [Spirochaetaceae bacterium]|jgi:hypothetical protein|nr:hypothetical protein [Spirochaetaceae bacterium]
MKTKRSEAAYAGILVLSFFLALSFSGCASTRAVTQNSINDLGGHDALPQYQFYLSANVTLNDAEPYREQKSSNVLGTMTIRDVVVRDKIKIRKRTMGAILNSYIDADNLEVLEVCFEENDDTKRLFFKQAGPGLDHRYYLLYTEPTRRIVDYGGEPYVVSYSGGDRVYLRIKILRRSTEKINTRSAKGRRI